MELAEHPFVCGRLQLGNYWTNAFDIDPKA